MKYTIKQFNSEYPNDNACLLRVFNSRYGALTECPNCHKATKFHKISDRKCFSCQICGYHLYPLAGTIFHKSTTSLKSWFYAIFLFSNSRNGVSAKELERHLGVTYKTAWRIAKQLRTLMKSSGPQLFGKVEADETYIGGKKRTKDKSRMKWRGAVGKIPVVGMVERQGKIKAEVTPNVSGVTVPEIMGRNIKQGSTLYTDTSGVYHNAKNQGYTHFSVNHKKNEYARGPVHTNTIEGFWSQLKRSIDGTYHSVSAKYLQKYVDEFVYRYNQRGNDKPIFFSLLDQITPLA